MMLNLLDYAKIEMLGKMEVVMTKKAIFFDIDHTLWDENSVIPESTVEAIHRLQACGHVVFINSGRCRSFIRRENLLSIGFDGIISGCGTMVEYNGEVILYHTIDNEIVAHSLDVIRRYCFKPILEGRYNLYMDEDEFTDEKYANRLRAEMGEDLIPIDKNWMKWEISKFSCDTRDCDRASCFRDLSGYYHYMIHNESVAEFVPLGFDKATGMKFVCERLGIDMKDTVAFGDSANDRAMIESAGCGVVMGNGSDEMKKIADFVARPLNDDGILHACEDLGLYGD